MRLGDRQFLAAEHPHIAYGFFGKDAGEDAAVILEALALSQPSGAALVRVDQVHGALCLRAEDIDPAAAGLPQADALVTTTPGQALAIRTADCAPVLFYGETAAGAPVIGAAHAGWRGAFSGVLENTVAALQRCGAAAHSLRAVIGPCIQQESHEVDAAFYQRFCEQDPAHEDFFQSARRAGHYIFDLPGYCARRLAAAGVCPVVLTGVDTYKAPAAYFSFRRATQRGEEAHGRQMSVIAIRG